MPQPTAAVPLHTNLQLDPVDPDPLWRLIGDLFETTALIIARLGRDLMCGLIRRGCLASTIVQVGNKPEVNAYDLIFIPDAAAVSLDAAILRQVRRALAPSGS